MSPVSDDTLIKNCFKKYSAEKLRQAYLNGTLGMFYGVKTKTHGALNRKFDREGDPGRKPSGESTEDSIIVKFMRSQLTTEYDNKYDLNTFVRNCNEHTRNPLMLALSNSIIWLKSLNDACKLKRNFAIKIYQKTFVYNNVSKVYEFKRPPVLNTKVLPETPHLLKKFISFTELDKIAINNDWWFVDSDIRISALFEEACDRLINKEKSSCVSTLHIHETMNAISAGGDVPKSVVNMHIDKLVSDHFLEKIVIGDRVVYSPVDYYERELYVATCLKKLKQYTIDIDENMLSGALHECGINPDVDQLRAIRMAISHGASIVNGPGGTGKTSTVLKVVHKYEVLAGTNEFYLAPTHSSKTQLAMAVGIEKKDVRTVKKAVYTYSQKRDCTFKSDMKQHILDNNQTNKNRRVHIYIDEFSMVGVEDLYLLLLAASDVNYSITFIGDQWQLAPMSWGQPLADMLNSGMVANVELKTIYRAEFKDIACFCQKVRPRSCENSYWTFNKGKPRNYVLNDVRNVQACFTESMQNTEKHIRETLKILKSNGVRECDVRIVTWSSKDTEKYAKIFREVFNDAAFCDDKFVIGDSVIITENYKHILKNGDTCKIVYVRDSRFGVEFWGSKIDLTADELKNFEEEYPECALETFEEEDSCLLTVRVLIPASHIVPATCITVHRSQGKGFDYIIFARDGGSCAGVGRLLYTGYSRSKKGLFIVGNEKFFNGSYARIPGDERDTLLLHFLTDEEMEGEQSNTFDDMTCNNDRKIGMAKRRKIPKEVRNDVWDKWNKGLRYGKCYVCAKGLDCMHFHCGHIVAYKECLSNCTENLRPICPGCNSSMGTKNLEEYKLQYYASV